MFNEPRSTLNEEEKRVVELVKQYKEGKTEAFDQLYSLIYSNMYYFIYKMIRDEYAAEDILQEVFLQAYRNIPKIEKPQAFKKWINQTAYHAAIDYIRSNRNRIEKTEGLDGQEGVAQEPSTHTDACMHVIEKERKDKVMQAVDSLKLPFRTAVMLKYFSGLKEREIADITGVPVGTVKSRLNTAKKELTGKLSGLYSVAPFFFIRLGYMKQAEGTALAAGMNVKARTVRRIAAMTTGIAAGTAAVVLTAGPSISALTVYEPAKYVNEQNIEFSVDSSFPISKAEVENTKYEVVKRNGKYQVAVSENGEYTIRVTDSNGRSAEKKVTIKNIDSGCPEYVSYREKGSDMVLFFQDSLSGIAWDSVSFTDRNGLPVKPQGVDTGSGTVQIAGKDFPVLAHVEDMAGNYGEYKIHCNTVKVGGGDAE